MYGKSSGISIRAVACHAALALLSVSAFADTTVSAGGFDRFMALSTGSNAMAVGIGSNGVPLVTPKYAAAVNVGQMGVFNDAASKGLEVRGNTSVPIGTSGRVVPVSVVAKVPVAKLAQAAVGLAAGPVGIVAALAIPYLYDWYQAAKLRANAGGTGFERSDPTVCTVAPCGNYSYFIAGPWVATKAAACLQAPANQVMRYCPADNYCHGHDYYDGANAPVCDGPIYIQPYVQSYEPQAPVWLATTNAEAQAQLEANQPLAQVLPTLLERGASVDVGVPTVTGPATVQGPTTTTTTAAQNGNPATSTVNNTTYNVSYAGDTVTYNDTTSSVVNNGTTVTTTTTTKEAGPPDDPCKTKDSIGCSPFGTPVDQTLPKSTLEIAMTPVTFSTVAGCPNDLAMNFSIMGNSFSPSFSYAKMCTTTTDFVRPVVLILAFAAAAYIFVGGLKS